MKIILILRALIFTFLVFPLVTAVLSAMGYLGYVFTGHRRMIDLCGKWWAQSVIWFLGVRCVVKGLEHRPTSGCLYLFNHSSFLDIFVIVKEVFGIRFGAKIEFFSVPIFRLALIAAGVLPIARNNREKAIKVLHEAEERARRGEKFALSPEGGRNHEEKLLPFKSGPFIFAIKAGVPVVPVIIKGAHAAWPKGSFFPCIHSWHEEISVEFLPAVPTTQYSVETRNELSHFVREIMLPYFN